MNYILSTAERSHCVCDGEMHRHLYKTFETTGIKINTLDVTRPQNSLRQLVKRKEFLLFKAKMRLSRL